MEDPVLSRKTGHVGWLTFNRPAQRNAMSNEMLDLFFSKLKAMDADPEIRCIVANGAGGNFIAGGDVRAWDRLKTMSPEERGADFWERLGPVLPLIEFIDGMDTPFIVAPQGYSVGAGLSFVLAADFVIADDTAKFIFGNIRMSLVPDMGITYFLPRLTGQRRAMELALFGSQIDAAQAKADGIVDEVVPPDALEATIMDLGARIAAAPARAVAETRKLLRASRNRALADQLRAETDGIALCAGEDDFIEAITAFAERRPAVFGVRKPA
ncbi:enoyl-CoA hydratase/isomerase family protein [Sphingobium sp. EM0848]|uniref:enoyl-CoA hydratase/isomerase family protein n=1 Tax=Sphingobium sp. EM0848 TaxID=2743473 RepID=UPI00159C57F6|nr:enoyl-CoA hydratase/isomerase family protein [Sphingobium sp. EM0848]